jgi:hypothetical protein
VESETSREIDSASPSGAEAPSGSTAPVDPPQAVPQVGKSHLVTGWKRLLSKLPIRHSGTAERATAPYPHPLTVRLALAALVVSSISIVLASLAGYIAYSNLREAIRNNNLPAELNLDANLLRPPANLDKGIIELQVRNLGRSGASSLRIQRTFGIAFREKLSRGDHRPNPIKEAALAASRHIGDRDAILAAMPDIAYRLERPATVPIIDLSPGASKTLSIVGTMLHVNLERAIEKDRAHLVLGISVAYETQGKEQIRTFCFEHLTNEGSVRGENVKLYECGRGMLYVFQ